MGEMVFLSPASFLRKKMKNLGLSSSSTGLDLSSFRTEWQKWTFLDLVRSFAMVVFYAMVWFARILLVFLPQRIPLYGLSSDLEFGNSSTGRNEPPYGPTEIELDQTNVLTSGAIGRALVQVLALVNDLPASSRKYSFARGLAEKIIQENTAHGQGYEFVNHAALSAGFNRTLVMLNRSLESIHTQRRSSGDLWSLPMKMIAMLPIIPSGGFKLELPFPLSLLRTQICHFIPSLSKTSTSVSNSGDIFPGPAVSSFNVGDTQMAEKLAQELLWTAEKLAEASALDEGIAQWSTSSSLASISLVSSPSVQRALVRLFALFAKELVNENAEFPRDVRFEILLLWLPLLCTATHGGDGPIFTVSENMEVENTLEKVIQALPDSDQEVIFAIWLQEFALSLSDWPNLQPSYDRWCNTTRKLSHQGRLTEAL